MIKKALTLTALLVIIFSCYSSNQSDTNNNSPQYINGCVISEKMLMGWCPMPNSNYIVPIEKNDSNRKIIHIPYYNSGNISGFSNTVILEENKIQLIVIPTDSIEISSISENNLNTWEASNILGIKVILANTTGETLRQTLQDGSIRLIQEAKNSNGQWSHIEYWMNSWCGNSYFGSLVLPPDSYVVFGIYRYAGDYKTNLRCRLSLGGKSNPQLIISNEFEGSINLGQFIKDQEPNRWLEFF